MYALAMQAWAALFDPAAQLHSNEHFGNGGDVVVCLREDGQIETMELLDFYEARTLRGIEVDLGGSGLSWQEKLEIAFERLENVDQGRAQRYRSWASTFESESLILDNVVLTDIPDSQHIALPRDQNCNIQQIVIHREPRFPEDRRYTIDGYLWQWLIAHERYDDIAGVVLHELIFREGVGFGLTHSIGVRYLAAKIASDSFTGIAPRGYVDFLTGIGFGTFHTHGVWIDLRMGRPRWYDDINIAGAYALSGTEVEWQNERIMIKCEVGFFPDGSLQGFSLAYPHSLSIESNGRTYVTDASSGGGSLEECLRSHGDGVWLDKPGHLSRFYSTSGVTIGGPSYEVQLVGEISLDFDGAVAEGALSAVYVGYALINGYRCITAPGVVRFQNGNLDQLNVAPCSVNVGRSTVELAGPIRVDFKSGSLISGRLTPGEHPIWVGNRLVRFQGSHKGSDGRVDFYARTGSLRTATLAMNVALSTSDGAVAQYFAGQALEFDESGAVIGVLP